MTMRVARIPRVLQVLILSSSGRCNLLKYNVYNSGNTNFSTLSNICYFIPSIYLQNKNNAAGKFDGLIRNNNNSFHKSSFDLDKLQKYKVKIRPGNEKSLEKIKKQHEERRQLKLTQKLHNKRFTIVKETDLVEVVSEEYEQIGEMQLHVARQMAKDQKMKLIKVKDEKNPSYMLMKYETMIEMRQKKKEEKSHEKKTEPRQFFINAYIAEHDLQIKLKKMHKVLTHHKPVEIFLMKDVKMEESLESRRKLIHNHLEPVGYIAEQESGPKHLLYLPLKDTNQNEDDVDKS